MNTPKLQPDRDTQSDPTGASLASSRVVGFRFRRGASAGGHLMN